MFRKLAQKCPPSAVSQALRRRRHCLIADAMILWSSFAHSRRSLHFSS